MTLKSQGPGRRSAPGLALFTAAAQVLGTALLAQGRPGPAGYTLLVLGGFALADRHRFPRRNFVVVVAFAVAYHVLWPPVGVTLLAPVFAASAALVAGHRILVWAAAPGAYAVWAVLGPGAADRLLLGAAVVAGLGLAAEAVTLAARPVVRALRERRRLAEERERRQASEARLRIAAELHDVLGHHLSLINVRAGVGLHLMDREPEQARSALDTIRQASAEALGEVQSVLDSLYPDGQAAPRAPAPGLDRLDGLTADAGLPVRTVVDGEVRALPARTDRAAYRIVQEALTNVRRHAGPGAAATVTLGYEPAALVIRVDDDGGGAAPAHTPARPGNGITGMRERAATLGGTLSAGPAPEGGWRVQASLPLEAA
ncbi:histidine kinase [Dactylosporangium sp. NPDC049742]|uniref:sensor histidine kinase n=1 Tax=Dactylosporangium sp. NPDC049742 TaxID=3154737 RepID=UPI00341DF808